MAIYGLRDGQTTDVTWSAIEMAAIEYLVSAISACISATKRCADVYIYIFQDGESYGIVSRAIARTYDHFKEMKQTSCIYNNKSYKCVSINANMSLFLCCL